MITYLLMNTDISHISHYSLPGLQLASQTQGMLLLCQDELIALDDTGTQV